jgi:TonB family protein
MSRFEKKCFIGSATFHGLLLVVIFFGAAFMPKDKLSDMGPVVEFNPGGAPAPKGAAPADPPQPAPPPQEKVEPPPQQETVKQPDAEPPKPKVNRRDEPKETEKENGDLPVPVSKQANKKETPKNETKPRSLVNTTVVRRSNVVDQTAMKLAQARRDAALKAERAAQAAAAAQRNDAINAINRIVGSAGDGSSNTRVVNTTTIGGNGTGAGSGMATGRYGDGLKAIYDSRWVLPTDAYDEEAVAQVRVTVRRDGTVVSSAITKPSGNASFDRSVRAVLNNVTRVLPFPPEMKDAERVFTWRFERRTRLG